MSRRNRLYKATQAIPPAMRDFASLSTLLVGTTEEPIPLVMERILDGETASASETEIVTEQSETVSRKPWPDWLPCMHVRGTPCCGQRTVSGFQSTYPKAIFDPELMLLGIAKNMRDNAARTQKILQEQEAYNNKYHAESRSGGVDHYHPPHVAEQHHPGTIGGMMVFTWNHILYLERAHAFETFVKERGLGECYITGDAFNPNSGNRIQCLVWCVNPEGYKKFMEGYVD